ncbi:hypothetical protein LEP1GSC166_2493 [Leptospira kirschneri]|nr:hypothetical protein LEP1GSC166_2493 [Leptospira kirschneri]
MSLKKIPVIPIKLITVNFYYKTLFQYKILITLFYSSE